MARRDGRYKFIYSANTMSKMFQGTNLTVSYSEICKATNSKNLPDHSIEYLNTSFNNFKLID